MDPDIIALRARPQPGLETALWHYEVDSSNRIIVDVGAVQRRADIVKSVAASGRPSEVADTLRRAGIPFAWFGRGGGGWQQRGQDGNVSVKTLETAGRLQVVLFDCSYPNETPEWLDRLIRGFEGPKLREMLRIAAGEVFFDRAPRGPLSFLARAALDPRVVLALALALVIETVALATPLLLPWITSGKW